MANKDHGTVFSHGVFQKKLEDRLRQNHIDLMKPENKEMYKRIELKAQQSLLTALLEEFKQDLRNQLGVDI